MIKKASKEDAAALAELAIQLWPDHDPGELADEFRELTENEDTACFLKYVGGKPAAFALRKNCRDHKSLCPSPAC